MPLSRVVAGAVALIAVIVLIIPPYGPGDADPAAPNPVTGDAQNQFLHPTDGVLAGAGSSVLRGNYPAFGAVVERSSANFYALPSRNSEVVVSLNRLTEHGQQQVPLILKETTVRGHTWLKVLLPIRPNGTTGWVPEDSVRVTGIEYRIDVHLGAKRLDVYKGDQLWREIEIGVGTQDRPTPGGTFYLMELLQPPGPNSPYGTYTYVLNGYSNVLKEFNGGPGLLGIHGTNDPSSIGHEVSHGCVRMRNEDINALAGVLPLGTPVQIIA